jgi:septal ring factor EnvC (AmiA/AmiB activator)
MLGALSATGREMKRTIIYLGLLLASLAGLSAAPSAAPPAAPPDPAEAAAKLAEVRARIAALTGRLSDQLKERDALGARLREADLSITAQRRRLEALRASEAAAERRRAELSADAARVAAALDAERAALASEVRAAYMLGRQEEIKLLLNQKEPAAAGRMAVYYGYFARARSDQIADIDARVHRLESLVRNIDETAAGLQSLQADGIRELANLHRARDERAAALAAVSARVTDASDELARLKREEQAEEALVADLARVLKDFPVDSQKSFAAMRGALPWPVEGRIAAPFQEVRLGLKRNGVLIEAARGAKVRAPYFGRVVYADWLQGLGLLLIIGHEGNYMTLYGHVEVLYKSVGDWVAPGDVIASLGDSGGAAPQLYFEIRDGRTPRDPKLWLRTAP